VNVKLKGKNKLMNIRISVFYICTLLINTNINDLRAQNKVWSVDDCIHYALEKNIQVRQARVNNSISEENLKLAKSAWYPSANSSVRQNFDWSNQANTTTGALVFAGTNGTNISVNSGMTIYNGMLLHNSVKKSETDLEAARYTTEVIKETVSLNVLEAYLQVLYAEEQVNNSINQVNSTVQQLALAEERLKLGVIANSDYLQVKSQLATEKLTLATAQSQLEINRVTLMQLMELPVNDAFTIEHPDLDSLINIKSSPDPRDVYKISLEVKPEVKNAELNKKSSQIEVEIARAGFFPSLSVNAGLSTMYSGANTGSEFGSQIKNNISPAIGLSASIPIYQNRQVRSRVEIAKMNTTNAELDDYNVKNQLRKEIEQACLDVNSSQTEYEASAEVYQAAKESLEVATEKYFNGLMNSIDFLIQKTSFITAESTFLQSKYKLVFSYKVLDFYLGKPLSFTNSK
jgi:outer membrane protein